MSTPSKILLVQLFSNGDCLYATAVARQIKEDYPGATLTWAIADYCQQIIANNPYVDAVMVVPDINHRNWQAHWKAFHERLNRFQKDKVFDRIVFTQVIAQNFALYDYCIRSTIFRGYSIPLRVPVQPVLRLTENEIAKTEEFVRAHSIGRGVRAILFEYAPQSGQAGFSEDRARELAGKLTKEPGICVILSSGKKMLSGNPQVLDGSVLSLRETAHLSRYCSLLVGCSSGITWISTSEAGARIPMIQILDPRAYWLNSVVNDHKRFQLPVDHIIELFDGAGQKLEECIVEALRSDFAVARLKYHQEAPRQFKITRGIIVYLLGRGNLVGIWHHLRINLHLFGWDRLFLRSVWLGFIGFPVFWMRDAWKRWSTSDNSSGD